MQTKGLRYNPSNKAWAIGLESPSLLFFMKAIGNRLSNLRKTLRSTVFATGWQAYCAKDHATIGSRKSDRK